MLPMSGKFLLLGVMGMVWIMLYRHVLRIQGDKPFHIAAYERDKRKARFYFLSVWGGLGVAAISFLSLEALASVTFNSPLERDWVLSFVRGAGLWGLMTIALVWSQVGTRVGQVNSDGLSLTPLGESKSERTGQRDARR